MKVVTIFYILSIVLIHIEAAPLKSLERQSRVIARQQTTSSNDVAPAVTAANDEDDDDEDDDDDEPDLVDLVDDDDDDDDDDEDEDDEEEDDTPQGQAAPATDVNDDDEEDDDEDDYLDRLFDDILGDDGDEDDDDEIVRPAAANIQHQNVAVSSIEEVSPSATQNTGANIGISDGVDLPHTNGNGNVVPVGTGNAADEFVPASSASSNSNNEGALLGGDDDQEVDDDDEDDDDDIIGDDVIEARREARVIKNNVIDMSSDAFQERHNQFIDAIFARINRIVANNYDPFVLSLQSKRAHKGASVTIAKTSTKNKAHNQHSTLTKNKPDTKSELRSTVTVSSTKSTEQHHKISNDFHSIGNKLQYKGFGATHQSAQDKIQQQNPKQIQVEDGQPIWQESMKAFERTEIIPEKTKASAKDTTASQASKERIFVKTDISYISSNKDDNQRKLTIGRADKQNTNYSDIMKAPTVNKQQRLKQNAQSNERTQQHAVAKVVKEVEKQKTEGRLSGLASLKRVGNVKVVADPEARNSTIKAKFTLGPLILYVEKSIKRGNMQSIKSATARTNEMIGRIKFSVVNDIASLVSIKVQQPKQVEVESKDTHDHTHELIWKRTPKIAKLIKEKLKLAAETIFTPNGFEVVRL